MSVRPLLVLFPEIFTRPFRMIFENLFKSSLRLQRAIQASVAPSMLASQRSKEYSLYSLPPGSLSQTFIHSPRFGIFRCLRKPTGQWVEAPCSTPVRNGFEAGFSAVGCAAQSERDPPSKLMSQAAGSRPSRPPWTAPQRDFEDDRPFSLTSSRRASSRPSGPRCRVSAARPS